MDAEVRNFTCLVVILLDKDLTESELGADQTNCFRERNGYLAQWADNSVSYGRDKDGFFTAKLRLIVVVTYVVNADRQDLTLEPVLQLHPEVGLSVIDVLGNGRWNFKGERVL